MAIYTNAYGTYVGYIVLMLFMHALAVDSL